MSYGLRSSATKTQFKTNWIQNVPQMFSRMYQDPGCMGFTLSIEKNAYVSTLKGFVGDGIMQVTGLEQWHQTFNQIITHHFTVSTF